ncbi:MAG: hypothetical protein IJ661_05015 [Lachnospiraceae bacterium]|nr:hypothetical protein [Lachnospiraceae bacterium]
MLYSYKECKQRYHTDYALRNALVSGELIKISRGVYSDNGKEHDLSVIGKTYPYAVFTMNSAFYYHGLTDTIPRKYYLITDKDSSKIKDSRIVQYFDNSDSLGLGTEQKEYNGSTIKIFNRERMLVELIRHKKKLPFDYYKEIIANYRKLLYQLDIQAVEEYAEKLPKTRLVMETLRMEVF